MKCFHKHLFVVCNQSNQIQPNHPTINMLTIENTFDAFTEFHSHNYFERKYHIPIDTPSTKNIQIQNISNSGCSIYINTVVWLCTICIVPCNRHIVENPLKCIWVFGSDMRLACIFAMLKGTSIWWKHWIEFFSPSFAENHFQLPFGIKYDEYSKVIITWIK